MRRVTQLREAQGWSKLKLAKEASLTPCIVIWIEQGRFVPYSVQLDRLVQALGWQGEPLDLLREVEDD